MILPNGHDDLVHRTDGPQLPYTLTKGVTATQEGLVFDRTPLVQLFGDPEWLPFGADGYIVSWPDAAERLKYRDGEPWCYGGKDHIVCGNETEIGILDGWVISLHRLAAVLCDDAEGFRVLHWCVHSLTDT